MPVTTELAALFQTAWRSAGEVDSSEHESGAESALSALLQATRARAVGWWHRDRSDLRLLAFQAAGEMPSDVRCGFAAATRCVPLTRLELGCVRAAAEARPIVAREEAADRGLIGSASWLARFGATQSLAVPILQSGQVVGVPAIATADEFDEADPTWQTVQMLADCLATD